MPETDVEKTLNEIRDRVRVQIRNQSTSMSAVENGQRTTDLQAFESLRANLTVIDRSRNRLPPVISYRTGWIARVELWLKRILKRATHWFTWEQVNFNSATANSLKDVMSVLSSHQEILKDIESQLQKLALVANRIQVQLDILPANGHVRAIEQDGEEAKLIAAGLLPSEREERTESSSEMDIELENLARRLEELRALKTRLERLT